MQSILVYNPETRVGDPMRMPLSTLSALLLAGCLPPDCPPGQMLHADGVCVVASLVDDTDTVDLGRETDLEPEPEPDPETDQPDTDVAEPEPEGPACGDNAHVAGRECECDVDHDWCSASPLESDCCPIGSVDTDGVGEPIDSPDDSDSAWWDSEFDTDAWVPTGTTFSITLESALVATTDQNGSDWDLFFFTEPDVYAVAVAGGAAFWNSDAIEDTFSPTWGETMEITLEAGQSFELSFWDEDLQSGDDHIQTFDVSEAQLTTAVGGTLTLTGTNIMTADLSIAVVP